MTIIKSAVAMTTALMLSGCAAEMKETMPTSTVKASWYSHGKRTASGERFNPKEMTVAHRTLPFGTLVRLTNDNTGNTVVARVNDRGPFIKGRNLDVS